MSPPTTSDTRVTLTPYELEIVLVAVTGLWERASAADGASAPWTRDVRQVLERLETLEEAVSARDPRRAAVRLRVGGQRHVREE